LVAAQNSTLMGTRRVLPTGGFLLLDGDAASWPAGRQTVPTSSRKIVPPLDSISLLGLIAPVNRLSRNEHSLSISWVQANRSQPDKRLRGKTRKVDGASHHSFGRCTLARSELDAHCCGLGDDAVELLHLGSAPTMPQACFDFTFSRTCDFRLQPQMPATRSSSIFQLIPLKVWSRSRRRSLHRLHADCTVP